MLHEDGVHEEQWGRGPGEGLGSALDGSQCWRGDAGLCCGPKVRPLSLRPGDWVIEGDEIESPKPLEMTREWECEVFNLGGGNRTEWGAGAGGSI